MRYSCFAFLMFAKPSGKPCVHRHLWNMRIDKYLKVAARLIKGVRFANGDPLRQANNRKQQVVKASYDVKK